MMGSFKILLVLLFLPWWMAFCELPLRGKVLRIAISDSTTYNRASTLEMLDWLAKSLGMSYKLLEKNGSAFSNTSKVAGMSTYLLNGEADLVLVAVAMSSPLYQQFDLPHPYIQNNFKLLIPVGNYSSDIGGPWKPYTPQVWGFIVLSVVAIIIALYGISGFTRIRTRFPLNLGSSVEYTIQVILGQGGYLSLNTHSIRLAASAWCLGAFFLYNFYNSTLVSHITSLNKKPIIDSIYDLPNKPNVHVAVQEGFAPDRIISKAEGGILKYLDDSLNRKTSIRCQKIEQCIEKVAQGTHVLIQVPEFLLAYLDQDLKKNGKCRMTMLEKGFMMALASLALPKNSPYTRLISQEIIRLQGTGLARKWTEMYLVNPTKCLNVFKYRQPQTVRISLDNLVSAFVILLTGLGISLLVFILEVFIGRFSTNY